MWRILGPVESRFEHFAVKMCYGIHDFTLPTLNFLNGSFQQKPLLGYWSWTSDIAKKVYDQFEKLKVLPLNHSLKMSGFLAILLFSTVLIDRPMVGEL